MPNGKNVANRTVRILYDSAWISIVDYSEDNDDEKPNQNPEVDTKVDIK